MNEFPWGAVAACAGVAGIMLAVFRSWKKSIEDLAVLKSDVERLQRGQDLRAKDVADILHQAGDERDADKLISAYQAGTATDAELHRLAQIMRAVADDDTQGEGLRSAAAEMYRTIEQRLLEQK